MAECSRSNGDTAGEKRSMTRKVAPASRGEEASAKHRYGRGTFEAHPNYVRYMKMIVADPAYADMPNATSADGRINWQVSSGRTTSFYRYYEARRDWWEARADALGLPGSGNDQDRFSIAARKIHPTGRRACRLCGEDRNVGYFYLNQRAASRLNKLLEEPVFERGQPIIDVLTEIEEHDRQHDSDLTGALRALFPEREDVFDLIGFKSKAFEETNHLRSTWLSPGFMANPPDRLDGFHDYCLKCRGSNDPGRSSLNLRSYQHDRRAFQWWAEGDWFLADALYTAAGAGTCSICGKSVDKVSPDHIGPLACGFKQLPLFAPTCRSCNSSKNRRMRAADVALLIAYEEQTGDSAASWQVRGLWDAHKESLTSDREAEELSAYMRGMQDAFLRVLHQLLVAREAQFLASLLGPRYAFYTHEFDGLDPSKLTFESVKTEKVATPLRSSLACRSVRIAFEELKAYVAKNVEARKIKTVFHTPTRELGQAVVEFASELDRSKLDDEWDELVAEIGSSDEVADAKITREIAWLLDSKDPISSRKNQKLKDLLTTGFSRVGADTPLA
jgi:Alw26I/Eco31I/Esp3I family type II restriction endonuclease